jgi:hypothetical protein
VLTIVRLKKNHVVVANLLWKAFNVRFANILQRLDKHREMVDLEIEIAQVKIASMTLKSQMGEKQRNDRFEKMLEQHTTIVSQQLTNYGVGEKGMSVSYKLLRRHTNVSEAILVNQFKTWLDPPPFAEIFERLRAMHLDGTAGWIYETKEYTDWVGEKSGKRPSLPMANFLWVRGKASNLRS